MKYTVTLSRPSRQYRVVEDIEAGSEAEARSMALRVSRVYDDDPFGATFDDARAGRCVISSWSGSYGGRQPVRVERIEARTNSWMCPDCSVVVALDHEFNVEYHRPGCARISSPRGGPSHPSAKKYCKACNRNTSWQDGRCLSCEAIAAFPTDEQTGYRR